MSPLRRLLGLAGLAIALVDPVAAKEAQQIPKHDEAAKCKKDVDCQDSSDGGYCIGWSIEFGSKYNGRCGAKASGIGACSRDLECKSGHCTGGYCLDMGKKCEEGSRKPGCSFQIELDRSNGDGLGIVVSEPSEVVQTVDDGLVKEWNKKHPKQEVKIEDRIASVNGVKFWEKGMLVEAQKKEVLKIVLVAGAPAPKAKGKWEIQVNNLRVGGGDHSPALVASLALGTCAFLAGAAILVQRRRSASELVPESACE